MRKTEDNSVVHMLKPIGNFGEYANSHNRERACLEKLRNMDDFYMYFPEVVSIDSRLLVTQCFGQSLELRSYRTSLESDEGMMFKAVQAGTKAALEWLHLNEIVHCDVHIGNILINAHNVIKLTDLGSAHTIGEEYSEVYTRRGFTFIPFLKASMEAQLKDSNKYFACADHDILSLFFVLAWMKNWEFHMFPSIPRQKQLFGNFVEFGNFNWSKLEEVNWEDVRNMGFRG